MFNGFVEYLQVGTQLYAHGKWWTGIKYIKDDYWTAVEGKGNPPCIVYMIKQTEKDKEYQKECLSKENSNG